MKKIVYLVLAILVVVSTIIIFSLGPSKDLAENKKNALVTETEIKKVDTVWTCSMHPFIKLPKPGQCPICAMDLIPLKESGEVEVSESRTAISLSPYAIKLAKIMTQKAKRMPVVKEVRLVGKIEFDETRVKNITARIAGRIDKLYVNYTGMEVKKGAALFALYSPEIFSSQEELINAYKTVKREKNKPNSRLKRHAINTLDAIREKFRLWGITPKQIKAIEKSRKPKDHITIYSPIAGIVTSKNVNEGSYVKTGTVICTIADLSNVWVKLDAYESELAMIQKGQEVEFTTQAYPGEIFRGKVVFVDPILDKGTRTVKIRVNAKNTKGKLKPEMFVHSIIKVELSADGTALDKNAKKNDAIEYPLVIPKTAPLITGKRAVVYVVMPKHAGHFEGREIVLGPKTKNYYIVKSGLFEGEDVVSKGNFKIDSALQIMAKPSMMSMASQKDIANRKDYNAKFPIIDEILNNYFQMQHYLSQDDFSKAKIYTKNLEKVLKNNLKMLTSHFKQNKNWENLAHFANKANNAKNIADLRKSFFDISQDLIAFIKQSHIIGSSQHAYIFNCPMAFDGKGGNWLQNVSGIKNPYYGSMMLTCGSLTETINNHN